MATDTMMAMDILNHESQAKQHAQTTDSEEFTDPTIVTDEMEKETKDEVMKPTLILNLTPQHVAANDNDPEDSYLRKENQKCCNRDIRVRFTRFVAYQLTTEQ